MTRQFSTALGLAIVLGISPWVVRMPAQDQTQEPPTSPAANPVDQTVYTVLKDVINRGADLYNPPAYDRAGCYRLYQGALIVTRPLLSHRPDLQHAIDEAVADAEKEPKIGERAFILRAVIDRVRAETNPRRGTDTSAGGKKPVALGPVGTTPAETPPAAEPKPDRKPVETSKPVDPAKPAEPAKPAPKPPF